MAILYRDVKCAELNALFSLAGRGGVLFLDLFFLGDASRYKFTSTVS